MPVALALGMEGNTRQGCGRNDVQLLVRPGATWVSLGVSLELKELLW